MKKTVIFFLVGLLAGCGGPEEGSAADFAAYCEGEPVRTTVFLIDRTDRYDETDRARFANGAVGLLNDLRAGEYLVVYPYGDDPGRLDPAWRTCVPGCLDETGDANNWGEFCSRAVINRHKQQFQQVFVQKMRDWVTLNEDVAANPIIHTIKALSHEFEGRHIDRLVIFSDMIEFSPLSKTISTFDDKTGESLLKKARELGVADGVLSGADVIAFGFGKPLGEDLKERPELRLSASVRDSLRTFWEAYFREVVNAASFALRSNYEQ